MGSVIDGVLRCLTEIWWAVMKGVGDGCSVAAVSR